MGRRTVALISGLALCLALLGSWFVRIGQEDAAATRTPVAGESTRLEGSMPAGLAGSSLLISAVEYSPIDITDWNGQQLDLSLQRLSSR